MVIGKTVFFGYLKKLKFDDFFTFCLESDSNRFGTLKNVIFKWNNVKYTNFNHVVDKFKHYVLYNKKKKGFLREWFFNIKKY